MPPLTPPPTVMLEVAATPILIQPARARPMLEVPMELTWAFRVAMATITTTPTLILRTVFDPVVDNKDNKEEAFRFHHINLCS